mmetsp:Transcript_17664/g.35472  ORF Transcript_17664/g.35472 Transcript_17664/m.35472 type:complete len:246 (-) Transcript_17664:532-1269(-)
MVCVRARMVPREDRIRERDLVHTLKSNLPSSSCHLHRIQRREDVGRAYLQRIDGQGWDDNEVLSARAVPRPTRQRNEQDPTQPLSQPQQVTLNANLPPQSSTRSTLHSSHSGSSSFLTVALLYLASQFPVSSLSTMRAKNGSLFLNKPMPSIFFRSLPDSCSFRLPVTVADVRCAISTPPLDNFLASTLHLLEEMMSPTTKERLHCHAPFSLRTSIDILRASSAPPSVYSNGKDLSWSASAPSTL